MVLTKERVSTKPKISVNKLGEYIEATASRRKKIIEDQKYPQSFIVSRYSDARSALVENFCFKSSKFVLSTLKELEGRVTFTDFQTQDAELSKEALQSFIDCEAQIADKISDSDLTFISYEGKNPKIIISNVEVSVNPDLIIRGTKRGKKVIGAIKFHLSKTNQLSNEAASNISTLLKQFVKENIANSDEKVENDLCISIDIFGKTFTTAPSSFQRRMQNISAACEEIALRWDKI